MRAFHNSRVEAYRHPTGAVAPGDEVTIRIDVQDAPDATVALRLWTTKDGERLVDMAALDAAYANAEADGSPNQPDGTAQGPAPTGDGRDMRFEARITPQDVGIVWYHFIITTADGQVRRYGAQDGRFGGEGQLRDWEPPSFQLSVAQPRPDTPWKAGDVCYCVAPAALYAGAGLASSLDALQELGVTTLLLTSDDPGPALQVCAGKAEDGEEGGRRTRGQIAANRQPQQASAWYRQLDEAAITRGMRVVPVGEWNRDDIPRTPGGISFGDALVRFLRGECTASNLVETAEALKDGQLAAAYPNALNPLAQPDGTRLLTQLGGAPAADMLSPHERTMFQLDDWHRGLAKGRLWCACLVQALAPGVPCITAGDEAGMEGYADTAPEAGTHAWGHGDADCKTIVGNALDLRHAYPQLDASDCMWFAANDDVFGMIRRNHDGAVCLLANASPDREHTVDIPLPGHLTPSDIVDGYRVPTVNAADAAPCPGLHTAARYARVHVGRTGARLLQLHPRRRLEKPMEPGLGVLAHITSLPMPASRIDEDGRPTQPGTLGAPARAFVDWLAKAGVRYWQVLPVNPTDAFGSPYAGISAFAGNDQLLEDAETIGQPNAARDDDGFAAFCHQEADWLEPYVAFMAIRQTHGVGKAWYDWPEAFRRYRPDLLQGHPDLQRIAQEHRRRQFAFQRQWLELRAYAASHGIQVVGDMPIYVCADSADVWAHPELFQLGEGGTPAVVAGCPPDAFAVDGQKWGNPLYDWDRIRDTGYAWWLRRLERSFQLYDFVRLDHFIGFARYFSIPAQEMARSGRYHPGPGIRFFQCARKAFGPLPIIAEDLGYITPTVRALSAQCGFPGMDILQFADGGNPLAGYHPRPEKIVYTGTHDNQTLVGYVKERYPGEDATEVANRLMDAVLSCPADVCVLPLQDVLGLDDSARMNVPGTAQGNWTWQADGTMVDAAGERLAALCSRFREMRTR